VVWASGLLRIGEMSKLAKSAGVPKMEIAPTQPVDPNE
tara:strand:- start:786 stop:899 length:114 start_codon:yes stop_codon:yes gene_type:complete